MTILQALKSKVSYPIKDDTLLAILIERGINGENDFNLSVAKSNSFKGAVADLYLHLATVPNISEGGMSVSYGDKNTFLSLYSALKKEIKEEDNSSNATCVFVGYKDN